MLRIVNTIYNITTGKYVTINHEDGTKFIGICKCYDKNYDIYAPNDKHTSWGLSCESIDDMRDSLLKDFLDGIIINIRLL
jgi:hypothetical protein